MVILLDSLLKHPLWGKKGLKLTTQVLAVDRTRNLALVTLTPLGLSSFLCKMKARRHQRKKFCDFVKHQHFRHWNVPF